MPDASGPLIGSAPIATGAGKQLTDSREAVKQMREEIREAVRDLDRLWQGIQNKTIGGAGGWQMNFDALHSAQNRLADTMQQQEERARKEPKPPPPGDPSFLDRLGNMYRGRFDPLNASRTAFQALSGQWTPAGEMVSAGYNVMQAAAATYAPFALVGAAGAAAYSIYARQTETQQTFADLRNQRASELLSLVTEDRITGRYGAPFLENMYKTREKTFQQEYAFRMETGGVFTRASARIFGGLSEAGQKAEQAGSQETERQANIAVYGQRYAEVTDIAKMEAESYEELENKARRRLANAGFWSQVGWWAESAVDIGNDPFAKRVHDEAIALQEKRMKDFVNARAIETRMKTEDAAKGIGYRVAIKNRNIYMFAMEERLYKSGLQWNSF